MLPGLGFARDAGAALHNPLESAACGICTKSYRIGWQGRQRAKNTASHGNQMLLPGNWSRVGCSCGQFTAGTIFFFSEVEFQSPSNVQRVKLPGPLDAVALLAEKVVHQQRGSTRYCWWVQTFRQNLGCPKDSKSMAAVSEISKSRLKTAGSSITWTKWLKKLGLSYGIFLYISMNQMLDLLASQVNLGWVKLDDSRLFMSFLYVIYS